MQKSVGRELSCSAPRSKLHAVPSRRSSRTQLNHPCGEQVGRGCKIGPNVSVAALCKIGDGVQLSNCVLVRRVEVRVPGSRATGSKLQVQGWH